MKTECVTRRSRKRHAIGVAAPESGRRSRAIFQQMPEVEVKSSITLSTLASDLFSALTQRQRLGAYLSQVSAGPEQFQGLTFVKPGVLT
jgi:hypothetical protein